MKAASSSLLIGSTVGLSDTTRNAGKSVSRKSVTSYLLSTDRKSSAGDIRLGTRTVKALRPGKTSKGSKSGRLPALTSPGQYFVLACADSRKAIRESNERNNCRATGPITVRAATLQPAPVPAPDPAPSQTDTPAPTPDGGGSTPPADPPAPTAPAAPTGLTATPGSTGNVQLAWTASSTATGYRVLRSTTSGGPYTPIATPTTTSYGDTGRADSQRYFYVVQASNAVGDSPSSAEASALGCVDGGGDNSPASPANVGTVASGNIVTVNGSICRGDEDWYSVRIAETDLTITGKQMSLGIDFTAGPLAAGGAGEMLLAAWESPAVNTAGPPLYVAASTKESGVNAGTYTWGETDGGANNGADDTKTFLVRVSGSTDAGNSYSLKFSNPNGG